MVQAHPGPALTDAMRSVRNLVCGFIYFLDSDSLSYSENLYLLNENLTNMFHIVVVGKASLNITGFL